MPAHPPSKRLKYTTKLTRAPLRNTSTSTLKKKIRDLSRLLSNEKIQLPATVRAENERALAAFKHDLAEAQRATNEARIAKKYHMVRFFERRKATRRLNKLTRDLSQSSPDDNPSIKALHHSAQVDLNYTLHYPKGEKYISLFKDPGKGSEVEAKREAIRREIERNMERGMLGDPTTTDMMKDGEGDMGEEYDDEEEVVTVKEVREVRELKEKVQRMEVNGDKGGVKKKRKRRADYEKEEKERGVEEGDGFFES